jgi:hypothetical protein
MNVHVSRNGKEIAVLTREIAEAAFRRGVFLPEDWAWSDGCTEWIPLRQMFPVSTVSHPFAGLKLSRKAVLLFVVIGLLVFLFILGALSPSDSHSTGSRSMPEFKGDGHGNATDEDFRKGAEWLLQRDKEREPK